MKIHMGCGSVYLDDYINIDLNAEELVTPDGISYPSQERVNGTTFDNYYQYSHNKKESVKRPTVVDIVGDITDIDFLREVIAGRKVTEIIAVQVLEHFTDSDAKQLLQDWIGLLDSGGEIIISVPNMVGIAREMGDAYKATIDGFMIDGREKMDFLYRHIYGSHRNEQSIHKSGYDSFKLSDMMRVCGARETTRMPNFHNYPAIVMKGIKE